MKIKNNEAFAKLLNTVRANASTLFQERVPVATQDNIQKVGNAIGEYTPFLNEFLDALINKIALTIISTKMANNPLAVLKKGMLENGTDVEEIFTEIAKAHTFDPELAESEVFKREKPDVRALFHRQNRTDFYKVTVSQAQLKGAFRSANNMGQLVSDIINSIYSADQYDEFIHMKELMARYEDKYHVKEVAPITDKDSTRNLVKAIKQGALDINFMSPNYNAQGVTTRTLPGEQVLFLHKDVSVDIDVDVLAWAFNMEKAEIKRRTIIVDDFGSMEDTYAILADQSWMQVYDTLFQAEAKFNPQGLYMNHWLHHWQIISASEFSNAIRFKVSSGDTFGAKTLLSDLKAEEVKPAITVEDIEKMFEDFLNGKLEFKDHYDVRKSIVENSGEVDPEEYHDFIEELEEIEEEKPKRSRKKKEVIE